MRGRGGGDGGRETTTQIQSLYFFSSTTNQPTRVHLVRIFPVIVVVVDKDGVAGAGAVAGAVAGGGGGDARRVVGADFVAASTAVHDAAAVHARYVGHASDSGAVDAGGLVIGDGGSATAACEKKFYLNIQPSRRQEKEWEGVATHSSTNHEPHPHTQSPSQKPPRRHTRSTQPDTSSPSA